MRLRIEKCAFLKVCYRMELQLELLFLLYLDHNTQTVLKFMFLGFWLWSYAVFLASGCTVQIHRLTADRNLQALRTVDNHLP